MGKFTAPLFRYNKFTSQMIHGHNHMSYTSSEDIEKYGENEFYGGKLEAYQDVLKLLGK